MTDGQRWWTIPEVADALRRRPKTIRNALYKHKDLRRQRVRGPGSHHPRRVLIVPDATVEALRRLLWEEVSTGK